MVFTSQSDGDTIEVRIQDNTVWLSQKLIASLFDVDRSAITKHLANIYQEGELIKEATCAKIAQVQIEGNRQVTRDIEFYNLDAIISVGYRVNSQRATQFRQWATSVLRDYAIRGYIIDKKRMENGTFLNEDYFEQWSYRCRTHYIENQRRKRTHGFDFVGKKSRWKNSEN